MTPRSKWDPRPVYTWVCGCGVRLIAGDAVELELLKGDHYDFHVEQGEFA